MSPFRVQLSGSTCGLGSLSVAKNQFSGISRSREAIGQCKYQRPRTAISNVSPVVVNRKTIVTSSQPLRTALPIRPRRVVSAPRSLFITHVRLTPTSSSHPPPSHPSRQSAPPSQPSSTLALNPDAPSTSTDEKSQAKTDWRIILKLAENIWPRGSPRTKIRVVGALGLLVAGKVLNVQVPFFFKEIVDAMNVPITAGSTVWVLAGASIAGCV